MPYLVTTHGFKSKDLKTSAVFLGPWCLSEDQVHQVGAESSRVLNRTPVSLQSRAERNKHADEVIERILPDLAKALNDVHGTQHSAHFWRICLGYWLSILVDAVYERWLCASAISDTDVVYTIETFGGNLGSVIPESTLSFNLLAQSAEWNQQIYETILRKYPNVNMLPSIDK